MADRKPNILFIMANDIGWFKFEHNREPKE